MHHETQKTNIGVGNSPDTVTHEMLLRSPWGAFIPLVQLHGQRFSGHTAEAAT